MRINHKLYILVPYRKIPGNIMQRIAFHAIMRRFIKNGTLHVVDHLGRKQSFYGAAGFPEITARFHTPTIYTKLLLNPDLALGEGYMHGEITVENASVYDFLFLLACNVDLKTVSLTKKWHGFALWQQKLARLVQYISPKKAKANVAHHYDLPPRLYDLFLDPDKQYSCAYYHSLENDLETAQLDKKRHIAAKLQLRPGLTVVEIGCGWGGLALYLAKTANVKVLGVTLSEEQYKIATRRAEEAGLSDRVQFVLKDYREIEGKFDRVVSVAMFEAVGLKHFNAFFNQMHKLLAEDGIAFLHSIGTEYDIGTSSLWITKYIFPDGYIPKLSEVIPAIEKQRFHITDIELLHHHYAATLQAWRQRFLANSHQLPEHLDDRFIRMWEYYLAGSEVSFQKLGLMIFQIVLMKNKKLIPLTRDYIYETEHAI